MYRTTCSGSYGFTLWLYYSNESQDSSTSIRVCCFPFVNELEIKIAADTYLTQSQVVIVSVSADSENKGKIVVDINLLPLGEQVDSLTAELTYNKFWRKRFSLDEDLFGDYDVDFIQREYFSSKSVISELNDQVIEWFSQCRGHGKREDGYVYFPLSD
ncbi:Concanavalin A-like lectin/glucanase, subgroup [Artemisia annua]|uniref:Concanavalin A-like lectin/glucanase, subgroup n=1 Tax=Artemisia annua TaxID=35608 RepID=A0A2U1PE53_ARTAN|nr:Concanavalin A-like lectin/glucanase, subgroup [Artemisia annua]